MINPLRPPFEDLNKKNTKPKKVAIVLVLVIIIIVFLLYVFAYKNPLKDENSEKSLLKKTAELPKVEVSEDSEVKIITEEVQTEEKKVPASKTKDKKSSENVKENTGLEDKNENSKKAINYTENSEDFLSSANTDSHVKENTENTVEKKESSENLSKSSIENNSESSKEANANSDAIIAKTFTSEDFKNKSKPQKTADGDYLFDTDKRCLENSELLEKTPEEINLIKNEIYARHGYIFKNAKLKKYFEAKDWYNPDPNFSPAEFNEFERENILILSKYN
ncbi:MAG: YARHG domain-containing protein [Ezakiella sp.]|nr:YARHG domain-containing protein [Ezakiella sp.]MDD7471327.1 YARHG domain-containing protein [Bacillota bacterium]MDY3923578.1 YARHG domain-containing protein [Ezakiella sp.]